MAIAQRYFNKSESELLYVPNLLKTIMILHAENEADKFKLYNAKHVTIFLAPIAFSPLQG